MQKEFSFDFQGKSHDAVIVAEDISVKPRFVYIHGSGSGSKERLRAYADALSKKGISVLAFDQSGAGKDAANIKQSSLEARVEESKFAIEHFADIDSLTVCGSSMGGEIAIRTLEIFPVKNLILFCPAIYDATAFTIKFCDGFTDIIRVTDSWKKSHAPKLLEKFTGKLLIVIGENDEVIPPGVIEMLNKHSPNVSKKEILRIPGMGHYNYQAWLLERPKMLQMVAEKFAEYAL